MKLSDFSLAGPADSAGETLATIRRFNETVSDYSRDSTVHAVFADQAARTPEAVAAIQGEETRTYRELDEASNRFANFLLGLGLEPEEFVAVSIEGTFDLLIALLGILKAGGAYCPIDPDTPEERCRYILDETRTRLLVAERSRVRRLNRLQWDCPALAHIVCIDSDDFLAEDEGEGEKMRQEVWDYVGETMTDDISGGGWQSSYTGAPLSREVMDDYGESALAKLRPFLTPETRVLEIGAASGITMFRVAPLVGRYVGTDLSPKILEWSRREASRRGLGRIRLEPLAAHEIDRLDEGDFDIVIINSVLQCFSGHNYLRAVLGRAIGLMKPAGRIFLGNVFDREKRDDFLRSLVDYKRAHPEARTKTDYSEELFIDRAFLEDLRHDLPAIAAIETSPLITAHASELSEYTFDAMLRIDRAAPPKSAIHGAGGRAGASVLGGDRMSQIAEGTAWPPAAASPPSSPRRRIQHDRRSVASSSAAPPLETSGPENLAYVMYTSGTSGRPKGALIPHRAILRLVINTNFIRLESSTRILMTGALAFDASTFEIWGALLNGGALCRAPEMALLDVAAMKEIITRHGINTIWLTASLFNQYVDTDVTVFAGLKYLLAGGEKLSTPHVNRAREAHPSLTFINGYGPTENTTFTACHVVDRVIEGDVPLGRPIANTRVWILDPESRVLPPGVAGEICAAGDGLARGYLNDPGLTARKFVEVDLEDGGHRVGAGLRPAPTESTPNRSTAFTRLYRTGDRGRWTADGLLEYLGRIDDQVKIRGYRIEPGEIEARLREDEAVRDAVVLARENPAEGRHLVAWVTGDFADPEEVRARLKAILPDYMIPTHLVKIDRLPLTANGKVDRRALPDPPRHARTADAAHELTATEAALAAIWSEILGLDGLSPDDDFFDVGGHSLKVTRLVALIHDRLGVTVPLAAVFRAPRLRDLARFIVESARFGVSLADETMVALGKGPRTVFALPPGTGDVLSYIPLAEHISDWTIKAFNFIEVPTRIADYANLIDADQPEGEIFLLGYSSGGNLAYQVAVELERRGRTVDRIVMIDAARKAAPIPYDEEKVMEAAAAFLDHETIRPYLASPVLRQKLEERIKASYRHYCAAIDATPVAAAILLIAATERSETAPAISLERWNELACGGFRLYHGHGDHQTMLFEESLIANAALLRHALSPSGRDSR
jgi:amino acid adenylation domain-containing protein